MACWSDLSPDLIDAIFCKVPLQDLSRLVSKEWSARLCEFIKGEWLIVRVYELGNQQIPVFFLFNSKRKQWSKLELNNSQLQSSTLGFHFGRDGVLGILMHGYTSRGADMVVGNPLKNQWVTIRSPLGHVGRSFHCGDISHAFLLPPRNVDNIGYRILTLHRRGFCYVPLVYDFVSRKWDWKLHSSSNTLQTSSFCFSYSSNTMYGIGLHCEILHKTHKSRSMGRAIGVAVCKYELDKDTWTELVTGIPCGLSDSKRGLPVAAICYGGQLLMVGGLLGEVEKLGIWRLQEWGTGDTWEMVTECPSDLLSRATSKLPHEEQSTKKYSHTEVCSWQDGSVWVWRKGYILKYNLLLREWDLVQELPYEASYFWATNNTLSF